MILYHYPHCPFCQRIRLLLGFKGIKYEEKVLSYDDKEMPQKLAGTHMLPIIKFDDGKIVNESIDILREIEQRYPHPMAFIGPIESKLQWASMAAVGIPRYFELLLPFYLDHYQEFQDFPEGAVYYKKSKEEKRGKTFEEIKKNANELFEKNIRPYLDPIIEKVEDEYFIMGPTFSVADCILAADLSGLRIVPQIQLPSEIIHYVERVEKKCGVGLLESHPAL